MWELCSESFHHSHHVKTRENRVARLCNRMLSYAGMRLSVSRIFPRRTRACLFSYTFNCASDWMSCVSAHCCLLFRADDKSPLTQTLVLVFRGCLLFPVGLTQCSKTTTPKSFFSCTATPGWFLDFLPTIGAMSEADGGLEELSPGAVPHSNGQKGGAETPGWNLCSVAPRH